MHGAAAEPLKTAATDENTVVLLADFYLGGDGNDEPFTARMILRGRMLGRFRRFSISSLGVAIRS